MVSKCTRSQMRNPHTNRCISKTGTTAKRVKNGTYQRSRALATKSRRTSATRKERPSPRRSAALERIGARGRGGDGKMWVVKPRSNGTQFWART